MRKILLLLGICWHKWLYYGNLNSYCFLGVKYKFAYREYKVCQKCGKAKYVSQNFWFSLNSRESEILKCKIADGVVRISDKY